MEMPVPVIIYNEQSAWLSENIKWNAKSHVEGLRDIGFLSCFVCFVKVGATNENPPWVFYPGDDLNVPLEFCSSV